MVIFNLIMLKLSFFFFVCLFVCNLIYFLKYFPLYLVMIELYEGWNFNSGNYLFTTDTK